MIPLIKVYTERCILLIIDYFCCSSLHVGSPYDLRGQLHSIYWVKQTKQLEVCLMMNDVRPESLAFNVSRVHAFVETVLCLRMTVAIQMFILNCRFVDVHSFYS